MLTLSWCAAIGRSPFFLTFYAPSSKAVLGSAPLSWAGAAFHPDVLSLHTRLISNGSCLQWDAVSFEARQDSVMLLSRDKALARSADARFSAGPPTCVLPQLLGASLSHLPP